MPTYDYVCEACSHELEIFQSIKESPKRKCPECGKLKLRRLIGGGGAILFKGSGFYQTDYRSQSYQDGKQKEASAKSDSKKESSKSDSKGSADKKKSSGSGDKKSA